MTELEGLFPATALDIEFAVNRELKVFLFQVRPLKCPCPEGLVIREHKKLLERIRRKIDHGMRPHPYLFGR